MKHIKYAVVVTFFLFIPKINAITNIKVDEYSLVPLFDEYITKYNIFVSSTDESVNVSAVLSETDDYVTGTGNINVIDGKNVVTLKVVTKNMDIMTYELSIFKNYEEIPDYQDATLSDLMIVGHDIEFNPNIYEYEINVDLEERLEIEYEQTSEYSTVKISGNSNFKVGENVIKIAVTSKDKETSNIYTIRVNKLMSVFEESIQNEVITNENILGRETLTKKETNIITLVIITICSIVMLFLFYLIFIRKK